MIAMTDYTIPPDNTSPIVLHAGDVLRVENHGTSHNVAVNDGSTEEVGKGGTSILTTINDGFERVTGGTADLTTINGGYLFLDHATADHTKLNSYGSDIGVRDGSIAKNTVIQNGHLLVDATSIADTVTFQRATGKFVSEGIALDDPQSLKGIVSGLAVGDVLQFGGLDKGHSVDITSFEVKNHALTFTYNNGQHATYQLKDMEAGTTFSLNIGTVENGDTVSTLTVTKAPAHAEFAHLHRAPELTLPLVGVDAHHHDFGHHLFG
jgi:hypothetical protein